MSEFGSRTLRLAIERDGEIVASAEVEATLDLRRPGFVQPAGQSTKLVYQKRETSGESVRLLLTTLQGEVLYAEGPITLARRGESVEASFDGPVHVSET